MKKLLLAVTASTLIGTATLMAGPVTSAFTTFGTLPGATFGGSGIPNTDVAITTYEGVTLGLSATPRYANPSFGNDGAGTFFPSPGADTPATYGIWNFDFYADPGQASTAGYQVGLYYEFDPAYGNDESSLKTLGRVALSSTIQDSWNLGMPFLTGGVPLGGPAFDPTVAGQYSFILALYNAAGAEVARSAINVDVGGTPSVPESGSTAGTLALGLGGIIGASWLQRRRAAVKPIVL